MIAKTLWFAAFVSGLNQTAVIASGQSTPDPNQIARRVGFQLQCSACHGADGKRKSPDENLRLHRSDRPIGPLSCGAASADEQRQIGYRHASLGRQAFRGRELRGRRPVVDARQLPVERHSNSPRTHVFDWNRRDL